MKRRRADEHRRTSVPDRARTIRPPPPSSGASPPPVSNGARATLRPPAVPRFTGSWIPLGPDSPEASERAPERSLPSSEHVDLGMLIASSLPPPVWPEASEDPPTSWLDGLEVSQIARWVGAVAVALLLVTVGWWIGRAQGRAEARPPTMTPSPVGHPPADRATSASQQDEAAEDAGVGVPTAPSAPSPPPTREPSTAPPEPSPPAPARSEPATRPSRRVEVDQTPEKAQPDSGIPAPESLPEMPDRDAVREAMLAVEERVEKCAGARAGVATVRVDVASSGRVRQAVVQGRFAGTPQGSCIARAVREAELPPFRKPTLEIVYPFRIGSDAKPDAAR